ncbi:hypothetical protein [Afipia felis]|uniref:Uncharacterized protein n=2 Tax=Afipia felis TaxID=1035 RepID=A0A380W5Q5_AFIFE|nr:hypothetical protein [Afipia felis]EKS26712.1 hypothetical protein HMPREF9697_04015 [Afipia felis ATCC 53690]SUU76139.1 Uncharacterised protein [Afipia felis]SUU84206.1 Uncharacterised protein [Afipia felis]SUW28238.1 Uncharacterised protein [Afipia felis]
MSTQSHTITKTIVSGNGRSVLRARCSCGGFTVDAPRLSTAGRRGQDQKIAAHLAEQAQRESA